MSSIFPFFLFPFFFLPVYVFLWCIQNLDSSQQNSSQRELELLPEIQHCSSETTLNTLGQVRSLCCSSMFALTSVVNCRGLRTTGTEGVVLNCCVQVCVRSFVTCGHKNLCSVYVPRWCVSAELRSASQSFHTWGSTSWSCPLSEGCASSWHSALCTSYTFRSQDRKIIDWWLNSLFNVQASRRMLFLSSPVGIYLWHVYLKCPSLGMPI